ncbi:glycosyltransferase family 39 protein [Salegentibacter mishustinae]|jgi:4-amino-4-deoxy-L-arabinose transferase-like glycosyltransferase|uniref:ArnT family glycosyltransferase n=1 Tax=Salegentibacter mishustinae TaxID=270918 RepID=UPI001CE0B3D8|nr:glycosyltransferase family 39 protein [Salegentibacter mishustinae]UBZ06483.1 glycosyltransferase family 39 protein [Salegentibacter mishustinae]
MKLENKYMVLLVLAGIAVFFVNLDAIYINIMEARNFITAREMLNDNNWIFTTMNAEPRYEKPPLPTWLTAISMSIFGIEGLFGLRLPSAIMGLILVVFIYKFLLKITRNIELSFLAGLIATTSFYIVYSSRDGQWDIHTHSFMILAIFFLYKLYNSTKNWYLFATISGLFIGCSILSKGPVSLYALFLPFLIAYGFIYKFKGTKERWKAIALLVVVALISGGWWNLYVYLFDTRAVAEITSQETGRWLNYNVRPFYYYWSFFIQSGLWTIPSFVALLYPYLKDRVSNKKAYKFTLFWTLASVFLLSIIPEKKSRYLLPVLIPMAMNTSFYIKYLFNHFRSIKTKEAAVVYFHFGIFAVVGCIFPIAAYFYFEPMLQDILMWYILSSIFLFIIGVLMFRFLMLKKIKPVFYLSIFFLISVVWFGLPMADKINVNKDYNSIVNIDKHLKKYNTKVYDFNTFTPELIWEFGKPIPVLTQKNKMKMTNSDKFLILTGANLSDSLKQVFSNYKTTKIDSVDMNPVSTKHKERLYRELYLLEKEED